MARFDKISCSWETPIFGILIFIFCLGFLNPVKGWGQEGITINGRLIYHELNGKGEIFPPASTLDEFHISINHEGHWMIEVESLNQKDSIFLTFDGVDTYFVRYQEAVMGVKNGVLGIIGYQAISNKVNTAYISNGEYPFSPYNEARVQTLWLVYASGNYLHNLKIKTMPLPWLPARSSLLAFGFRVESDSSTDSPYFPNQIRFVRDLSLDLSTEDDEIRRPELDGKGEAWIAHLMNDLQERKATYTNGFVRGELVASNLTDRTDFKLPMSFIFRTFNPVLGDNPSSECLGEITSILDLSPAHPFVPPILGTLLVHDSRFRMQDNNHKLDEIDYSLRVGEKWKESNSPELLFKYRADVGTMPVSARPLPTSMREKRLVFAGLVLLVVFAIPLLLYKIASRKK